MAESTGTSLTEVRSRSSSQGERQSDMDVHLSPMFGAGPCVSCGPTAGLAYVTPRSVPQAELKQVMGVNDRWSYPWDKDGEQKSCII